MHDKLIALQDQCKAMMRDTITMNMERFKRISNTGLPADQRDIDLIKFTMDIVLGDYHANRVEEE
jgi:hypothetical protein